MVQAPPSAEPGTAGGSASSEPTSSAAGVQGWTVPDPTVAEVFDSLSEENLGFTLLRPSELPAGTRRLRIRAPGSVTLDTTFQVAPGNTTRLGLIALRSLP